MQLTVLITNIFDQAEVAEKIDQLQKLLPLGGFSIEKGKTQVVQTVKIDASKAAALLKDRLAELAQAHQLFGGTEAAPPAPLPPVIAAPSPADAAPSTIAPAAPPASTPSPNNDAPPAPSPPVAAAIPAPASSGETDKNGYTWDERIHAGTKAKNGDGTWRYKRGVHDDLVEQIEAAQRAARGQPMPPPATATVAPAPPVATPSPPAAAPAAPVPPSQDGKFWTFAKLTRMTQNALQTGVWTQEEMANALALLGVKDFPSLIMRVDLFPAYVAQLPESVVTPMLGG